MVYNCRVCFESDANGRLISMQNAKREDAVNYEILTGIHVS